MVLKKKNVNSYVYDTWNFIKKRNGIIKLLCGFIFIKKIREKEKTTK